MGPLKMLRNVWTSGETTNVGLKKPEMQYLTELRNKLQTVNETAQANAVKHQQLTKEYYDQRSTKRHLAVDSLVLLPQPVSTHKLYAAWSGPHRVIERLSDTNYVIDLDGRRAVRHINLLRPYHSRSEMVGVILSADADDSQSEDQLPTTIEYTDRDENDSILGVNCLTNNTKSYFRH